MSLSLSTVIRQLDSLNSTLCVLDRLFDLTQVKSLSLYHFDFSRLTSFPYFGVKLSRVCLKVTYSYPKVTYSYPRVTYSDPKVTHSEPTHLPLPPPASPSLCLAISQV